MKRRSNFALAATPGTVVLQRKLARRLATTIGNSLRFAKTGNRFPYDLVMNCMQVRRCYTNLLHSLEFSHECFE